MNNQRLLTGCVATLLLSAGVCAHGAPVTSLEEIFEAAESRSAQLRPAFTAVDEAEREISIAKSGRLPDINASLSLGYFGDGFTTKRNFSDYQKAAIPHLGNSLSVSVTQPVYTGGAVTSAIELAELKSTAARFASDFKRDNIRFQLAGFYLDIYKYRNRRRVVESNLAAARNVLAQMHARFEQGTALKNDITRYELLVSNFELELIRIDNTLKILNDNLVTIAGLPAETVIYPDEDILQRGLPVNGEGWWQAEAEANAPALSLARTSVALSRKAEELVRSERMPKIDLRGAWSMEGPILVEVPPINRNLSYWYVGVGVSYNLSSLYKSNRSLARSRTAVQRSIEELDAERENISMAVRADNIRYLEAYEELKTRSKSVELAERNYTITSTRYAADMALITDMLDAANAKLDAEQELVNAKINVIYCYYKLLFTSGKI